MLCFSLTSFRVNRPNVVKFTVLLKRVVVMEYVEAKVCLSSSTANKTTTEFRAPSWVEMALSIGTYIQGIIHRFLKSSNFLVCNICCCFLLFVFLFVFSSCWFSPCALCIVYRVTFQHSALLSPFTLLLG